MDHNKDLSLILGDCYTTDQAYRRLGIIRDFFLHYLYKLPKPDPDTYFTSPLDKAWFYQHKNFLDATFNVQNFSSVITHLLEQLNQVKPVIVLVAIELQEEELEKLIQKFRKESGKNYLFEFRVDPSLIAGCIFVIGGIYKDYSLRKKLTEPNSQIATTLEELVKNG